MVKLTAEYLHSWDIGIKGNAIRNKLEKPSIQKKFNLKIGKHNSFYIEEELEEELKQYIKDNFSKNKLNKNRNKNFTRGY